MTLLWAAVLGLLVALPLGRQRQFSVEVWLIAVSAWLALSTILRILDLAPVSTGRLHGLWQIRRPAKPPVGRLPRPLLALEGTLISARDSERAFALRLRPRLKQLTDHHLRTRHGIDAEHDPAAAVAALGSLAWLVEPDAEPDTADRKPTMAEIERLLELVGQPDHGQ